MTIKSLSIVAPEDVSGWLVHRGWERGGDAILALGSGVAVRQKFILAPWAARICHSAEVLELAPHLFAPVAVRGDLLALAATERDYQSAALLTDYLTQAEINWARDALYAMVPEERRGVELRSLESMIMNRY